MASDLEIARAAKLEPIETIAWKLGIPSGELIPHGQYMAKLSWEGMKQRFDSAKGNLILVTSVNPTPFGEGKTVTTIGLTQALCHIGKNATCVIREPSMGPVFGIKGGAAGGGQSQVLPMEEINLHFTGDLHAVTSAHNLLSSLIDNHIKHGNACNIDTNRVFWPRVVDLNDRSLREVVIGLGGPANGHVRQDRFDITAASEIMAIFCLATSLEDMQRRLGNIIVGYTRERKPVYARDLEADGAMTVLLKDALAPNLVQTLENNPAFIHGGPFANIAHGCNSVMATQVGLKLADYVVTEAGFGADLGAEKFFDIKCRKAGLQPAAAVVVGTIRALKMHGGVAREGLGKENVEAVRKGVSNIERHVVNTQQFGLPVIVALNRFITDTDAEVEAVKDILAEHGVEAIPCSHWSDGGAGAEDLAHKVVELADSGTANFKPIYPDAMPLMEKIETIASKIYHASGVSASQQVKNQLADWENMGLGHLPICIAKTQYSFSTDPNAKGAPTGHELPIREVRLSNGAEFIVAIAGEIMTMPGLPRVPAATKITLNEEGNIEGLF